MGQAYPDLPLSARERLAFNHFMDMLEDTEMRYQILQWRPGNMDEALARALEIEAFRRMKTVRGDALAPPRSRSGERGSRSHLRRRNGRVATGPERGNGFETPDARDLFPSGSWILD